MNVDKFDKGVGPAKGWQEHRGWALLHDAVAHPVMALSGYAGWAVRFHQWTGRRAWRPMHGLPPML